MEAEFACLYRRRQNIWLVLGETKITTMEYICGQVIRVPGYRLKNPDSIPGSRGSGTSSTQPRQYNWGANYVALVHERTLPTERPTLTWKEK
jgi:hypothetical protein